METVERQTTPILNIAWTRYANLDASSKRGTRLHYTIRRWILVLGVLSTLFAVLSQIFPRETSGLVGFVIRVLLVTSPIIASALAAIATRGFSSGDWLVKRAGAEEILKEIYFYRTILQNNKNRRAYLEKRLNEIQRQIYRGLGGEFAFESYDGPIPPNYNPNDPNSDPGFNDLSGEEYFRYRLENQLAWHNKKVNQYRAERFRLQLMIVLFGAAGALLAAFDTTTIWVALTASMTAALVGWQELRNLDAIIKNYSKVVMELTTLYDHWHNLEPEERTKSEFYKMVRGCEEVLWAQNTEYIRSMQEALKEADLEEEAGLVNRVIRASIESDARAKQAMQENLVSAAQETMQAAEQTAEETFQATIGSLMEEASSELVQQELEAMKQAVANAAEKTAERVSSFSSTLAEITKEFAHLEISRDTPKEELNTFLARLPKTKEVKG
ncbi:MAG TPA: SLATT domain-containing protein [Anaerolineales bacterium]|nr:SLATT domain-containing protein [Anaerolineales bacterium]